MAFYLHTNYKYSSSSNYKQTQQMLPLNTQVSTPLMIKTHFLICLGYKSMVDCKDTNPEVKRTKAAVAREKRTSSMNDGYWYG
jgi:hypothetical protein